MMMYVATLTTPAYSFLTGGETADDARATMRRAWDRHADLTGATWTFDDVADDVQVLPISPGAAFRDGSPFAL